MSKSPHRLRGDPAEAWRTLLFGEILRTLDAPAIVRAEPTIKLPRTGRWESGLARLRPALDDALGATAFAVAWRWACAEVDANAWPSLGLVARKAVDHAIDERPLDVLARVGDVVLRDGQGPGRAWVLALPGGVSVVSAENAGYRDWSGVDRIADIAAAWFDVPWSVSERG